MSNHVQEMAVLSPRILPGRTVGSHMRLQVMGLRKHSIHETLNTHPASRLGLKVYSLFSQPWKRI